MKFAVCLRSKDGYRRTFQEYFSSSLFTNDLPMNIATVSRKMVTLAVRGNFSLLSGSQMQSALSHLSQYVPDVL